MAGILLHTGTEKHKKAFLIQILKGQVNTAMQSCHLDMQGTCLIPGMNKRFRCYFVSRGTW